jgi:hypothetical protein
MHITMPSIVGIGGGSLFYSVTRSKVVLFLVRNGAFIIAKRFESYICMFSLNPLFFLMIISVVDCRQSSCFYNVESSIVEYRRTCTSVCYRVSVDMFKLGA